MKRDVQWPPQTADPIDVTERHPEHSVHAGQHRLDRPLRTWAEARPDDVAVVHPTGTLTISEFTALIDAFAHWVASCSMPGDRIGLASPSSIGALTALYAVPAAGRVLVPLNIRHTPAEQRAQLRRAGATVVMGDEALLRPLGDRGDVDGDAATWSRSQLAPPTPAGLGEFAAYGLGDDLAGGQRARNADAAWVIFTSGTTGPPKGVLLTEASLTSAITATAACRPLADDEVYLYPFPLYHVAAYNVLHAHWRQRPVILPGRFDAAEIVALTQQNQVTAMSLAPTMLRMLLDELARRAPSDVAAMMGSLRTINYGAAPMSPALLAEATDVLGCAFAQGYGMTELSGNAVFLDAAAHHRGLTTEPEILRSAGYAAPGVTVRIVDDAGNQVRAGEAGEVVVRAPQVCAGYLDDPIATAETIRDGWLHTGDVGTMAPDGLLTIVDRAKDIVVTGGENVASREVEDVLVTHDAVAQAAVFGVVDPHWGEAVTAAVVLAPSTDPGLSHDQAALTTLLRAHVGAVLAGYKKPRRVVVVDALPVNAGGKVDKRKLKELFSDTAHLEV